VGAERKTSGTHVENSTVNIDTISQVLTDYTSIAPHLYAMAVDRCSDIRILLKIHAVEFVSSGKTT